ncbi:hypothetical protein CK203_069001 [Vitis vinifera]|uniref:Uncharacterized protein n=1 Tax=Vitis vinifera TaxID=29760 RepID=A0A438F193_VITVI|nr:hypothetical protein CK203_069001 [Vitis vinifera]
MANAHSRSNLLTKVRVNGALLAEVDDTKDRGVLDPWHFSKKLKHQFRGVGSKKGGVEDLKDFKPISLVGVMFKLLAKVLVNRLKKVVGEVKEQHSGSYLKDGH